MNDIVVTTDSSTISVEVEKPGIITVDNTASVTISTVNQEVVTTELLGNIVKETTELNTVVSGAQGPQGIQGESSHYIYLIAGQVLGGNRVVGTNVLGKAVYPDRYTDANIIGITTSAALEGEIVQVQITGTMTEPSWNFTSYAPIFLSDSGQLTQAEPLSGLICIIAEPILSNKIYIDKQPIIWR